MTRQIDPSARLSDEAMHLSKTEPTALADRLGRKERFKDLFEQVRRDAGSGIDDIYPNIIAGAVRRTMHLGRAHHLIMARYRNAAADRHGVARIQHEAQNRRIKLSWVDAAVPNILVCKEAYLRGISGRLTQQL